MNRKASFVSVATMLNKLTDEELVALVGKPELLKKFAAELVADIVANTYVVPLSDGEAVNLLVRSYEYTKADAKTLVAKWRKLASDHGYTGPIAWEVRAGFTLKRHASQAGPCYEKFSKLQDWQLKNDEPTADSIVFWVPRLLEESISKNADEQKKLMADVRARYELPEHHVSNFGSAALISGLILAHFKRTGERTPLRSFYVRSDTIAALGGPRLRLGRFAEAGLRCIWDYDRDADGNLGVFPLGVELLPAKNASDQESHKS